MNPHDIKETTDRIDWTSIWDHLGPWLMIASACAAAIIVTDYLKKGKSNA